MDASVMLFAYLAVGVCAMYGSSVSAAQKRLRWGDLIVGLLWPAVVMVCLFARLFRV